MPDNVTILISNNLKIVLMTNSPSLVPIIFYDASSNICTALFFVMYSLVTTNPDLIYKLLCMHTSLCSVLFFVQASTILITPSLLIQFLDMFSFCSVVFT